MNARDRDAGAPRRVLVFLVLVAALAAGLAADRLPRPRVVRAEGVERAPVMPVAGPPRSLSSSWFCAGATAMPDGAADGVVIVANAGRNPLTGTFTVVPLEGDPRALPIVVEPLSRLILRQRDIVNSPYAAALVELDGGDAVVEHEVSGPLGASTAPCASFASDRWYVAAGSTAREDTMLLALFNPFPEDAIVDLAFSTDQGRAVPSAFTGIVVRGGRLGVVNVGDHVRRRTAVAVTATARTGRIVMDRIQLRGSAPTGVSLALAAPSPGRLWYFAEGLVSDGITERFHVYNPTDTEAEVSIELTLEEGAAEPFDLTIPPRDRVTVAADQEERVPRDVGHYAVVRSRNGVPVVAERSVTAAPPAPRAGTSDSLGARRTATTWVLASGSASEAVDEWVTVLNPGQAAATVSLHVLASGQLLPVEGLQGLSLEPGRRRAIRLTDHIRRQDLALRVTASEPVVVERGLYGVNAATLALSPGVPLR
ncbi:MAG TPA: DUF5719 family protein [Acidimicrobiales bacterium]|nr:DUF5719 family protein [Acidimicrobiales bacterium]